MTQPPRTPETDLKAVQLDLLGGHPCLDFVNTVERRGTPEAVDFLTDYAQLVAWCHHAGLLSADEFIRLHDAASHDRAQAKDVHRRAIELREVMAQVLDDLAHEQPPSAATLEPLNRSLQAPGARRALEPAAGGAAWRWPGLPSQLDAILGPLSWTAADLLTMKRAHPLRQCGGCGWLFLDTSRNHMRRWCSMAACGSKMKSRRQYQRKQAQATVELPPR
jgi:predicted RNA-binding Zn ribbon-like protein